MALAHRDIAKLLAKHGYTEPKQVGEGSFGKAVRVTNADGAKLICKMVDVSKASRKELQDAEKEGRLLADLKHPYIVRYRENFTENGWLCILMDFCEGGDLTKQIENARKRKQPIAEDQVLKWFTQAILALKYIHEKHILHRDLKPQNFFLSKNGVLKMGDFGIAKVLACTIAVARTQVGTPYYLSPELCQDKPYAWPSDIWAMGCILYEMCALKVPFDAANMPQLVQRITSNPVPSVPNVYSPFVRQLCTELLSRSQDRRPSPENILGRSKIQAIVKQMLEEAQAANRAEAAPKESAPTPEPPDGPPRQEIAFQKDDLVEYFSSAHQEWLAATVINVDDGGRIIVDLKPNTWISKAEQAVKVRPRRSNAGAAAAPAAVAAVPPAFNRPGSRPPSAAGPSKPLLCPGRAPSPGPGQRRGGPAGAAPSALRHGGRNIAGL